MEWNYNKLRGRIRECGLTQKEVADGIKVAPSTLSLTLNNQREFTPSEIFSLCKLLKIPFEELHLYFFCKLSFEKRN